MSCTLRSDTLMSHQSDLRHRSHLIPMRCQNDDTNRVLLVARTSLGRSNRRALHRRNSNDNCPSAWPCWVCHFCLRDASVLMSWPVNFRRPAAIASSTRTRCHQILQLPGKAQRGPREPLQQRGSRQVDPFNVRGVDRHPPAGCSRSSTRNWKMSGRE